MGILQSDTQPSLPGEERSGVASSVADVTSPAAFTCAANATGCEESLPPACPAAS
jgi:hypothetical protein